MMSDLRNGGSDLSPAKRALLELRLSQREATRRRDLEGPRRRQDGPAPLSSAQLRLWLVDQLHPGLAAYNVGRVLRLRGPLEVAALETALTGITERHAILRTALVVLDGEPVQRVGPPAPFELGQVDAGAAPDPEAAASPLITEELRRPFDLAAGALIRGRLIRLGEDDHILVLVTHHTASDERSKALFFSELSVRYAAALADRAPELGELPIEYADYAAWERERAAGPALASDLDWWRERLAGVPAELELPYDAPRPAISEFLGARHTEMLDSVTVERLRAIGRGEGATLFAVLLAAYQALLARYSGQDDIVVGAPISMRSRPELEGIVGLFGNMLVLRTAVEDDLRFHELVARVKDTVVGAFAHQEVPFERLVAEVAPPRDLSRMPLIDAMFNFIEQPSAEAPELEGLSVTPLDVDAGVAQLDLALVASVRPDGLSLTWEYSTELFEPDTISRMSAHLRRLLQAVADDPLVTVGALPLLSAAELTLLTGDLARTGAPIPDGCVHELIAARAAERPDAIAVRCGGESATYRELDALANGIAHRLVDAGVAPGSVVALELRRGVKMLAALLGVMKAGCTYVPLDRASPRRRSEDMLADSGAVAVLVDDGPVAAAGADAGAGGNAGADAGAGGDAGLPPEIALAGVGAAARPPELGSAPQAPMCLIYTSGSTGRPKGVVIEHRSVVNVLTSMCAELGITADDVFVAITTLTFDIAGLELLGTLLAGGQVVIGEDGVARDPEAIAALVREAGATWLQATPSSWRMLIDSGWAGASGLRALSGGEALSPALAESLSARVEELWNGYGPSEGTIYSTRWRYEPGSDTVPIGYPVANTACYVLDAHDRPVPLGVVGELCIGGTGVAPGYHARPELTAERFAADPFVPGGRMYRTGDRVRRRPDGALLHLGRSDFQVKIRGIRVEPGEIEATLGRHPAVREVVVTVREDEPGDQRLVAYVTGDASADELQALAAESLPSVMVPSTYVALRELPRSPNGKLDRGALPAPTVPAADRRSLTAPRTPLEEQLVGLWSDALRRDDVGVHDNVFNLGAHSLLVTRVVARIRETLAVELPLRRIYEAPTVAQQAGDLLGALLVREQSDDLESLLAELEGAP